MVVSSAGWPTAGRRSKVLARNAAESGYRYLDSAIFFGLQQPQQFHGSVGAWVSSPGALLWSAAALAED